MVRYQLAPLINHSISAEIGGLDVRQPVDDALRAAQFTLSVSGTR
jgi:hypothetical protein